MYYSQKLFEGFEFSKELKRKLVDMVKRGEPSSMWIPTKKEWLEAKVEITLGSCDDCCFRYACCDSCMFSDCGRIFEVKEVRRKENSMNTFDINELKPGMFIEFEPGFGYGYYIDPTMTLEVDDTGKFTGNRFDVNIDVLADNIETVYAYGKEPSKYPSIPPYDLANIIISGSADSLPNIRCVWSGVKPEAKEMTVEEISKALGYEVKIVKG